VLGALVGVVWVPAVFILVLAACSYGWWLGLPTALGGMVTVGLLFDRIGLLGNGSLERDLRQRLPASPRAEMVGLCRPESTSLRDISQRGGETDEQVGLLEFRGRTLVIVTEVGALTIPADGLTGLEQRPTDFLTQIGWLRVEWVEGTTHETILLASRRHPSIQRNVEETTALMERIREWHAASAYPEVMAEVAATSDAWEQELDLVRLA
jgi:hypothetical protein